jgi:D-3-phosphoglycerate dehydrogenase / 2-oxoglutarate reductase
VRVLVADRLPSEHLAALVAAGAEVEDRPELTTEGLPAAIAGHEVLIVRSTKVDAATLEAADRLGLVIRAGSGTNTIDRDAATRCGIAVSNVPGRNAVAVAELAFGLLLCLDRDLPAMVTDLRAGRWDKARYSRARGLHGVSVGVVGLGAIGLAFAERAHAFGMHVHAVARSDRDASVRARLEACEVRFVPDLPTLAAACDVLSFHVPLTDRTRGMVDRGFLALCRDGAWLINTSRGELVDEPALLEALDTRGMRAGLDVFHDEPAAASGVIDSPLARHPSVYGSHHVGASTAQAQRAVADEVVRMVTAFAAGTVLHCVNGVDPAAARVASAADPASQESAP